MWKKIILIIGGVILGLALLVQLLPYGRNHTNPPVVKEPAWDSPQTLALFQRACADCHSNNTNWRWYTNIAPFSWLIQHDVVEGREHMNFSECGVPREHGEGGEDAAEVILEGEMPPAKYTIIHPEARLSQIEKRALAQGLIISTCQ